MSRAWRILFETITSDLPIISFEKCSAIFRSDSLAESKIIMMLDTFLSLLVTFFKYTGRVHLGENPLNLPVESKESNLS